VWDGRIVKYLVDNGADVNMEGQFGRTPLQSLIAKYRTLKDVKEKAAFMEIAGFEEIARMVDAEEAKFDKAEKAERERLALRQRQWEQQRQWEGQLAWERELAKKKELSWERKQAEFRAPYAPTPPNTATPFTNTGDRRTLTYTPTPSRERVAPTPQMERCPGCDGRGDRICNTCRGKGYTRTCSTCRGTGTLQKPDRDAGKRCSNCKGTGNQPCGSGCNGTGKFPCNYGNCRGSGFITK